MREASENLKLAMGRARDLADRLVGEEGPDIASEPFPSASIGGVLGDFYGLAQDIAEWACFLHRQCERIERGL